MVSQDCWAERQMNLKREIKDVNSLAHSGWVRSGVALEIIAFLIVVFFAVDIKWYGGRTFFALVFADGIDGSGVAFDAVRYAVLFLAIAGVVCVLFGCSRVVKARNELPNRLPVN